MILIGEKINGTRLDVAKAIREKDENVIASLAKSQDECGSTYLDINAGTYPDREPDDMAWMVEIVQKVSTLPLCLDSANPQAIKAGLEAAGTLPLINSVSGERSRIDRLLPLALEYKTDLVLLALDDKGIPKSVSGRMKIVHRLVELAREGGLKDDQLYIDPLVTSISTGSLNAIVTLETIRVIKKEFPDAHVIAGASNISFGMPLRPVINRYFMAMAIQAGLDSAITDPSDRELITAIMTSEMLMGRDRFCMNFNKAFRAGWIGPAAVPTQGKMVRFI